ncbi:MAG TPA: hypothetical protein VND95_03350 [Stellaceae bacterium]|nr:hypothetical protein [Stellaceae bacterium]
MLRKLWLAGGLALSLAGCAVNPQTGLPTSGAADPLATLGKFTLTDLQNADKLALASNDGVAHTCFAYLIPVVTQAQAAQGGPGLPVSGAFSAFEAGRVAINNGKSLLTGVPSALNVACAPLVLDAANTVFALAAKVGVSVALPGIAGLLP